jgi:hypothetical protein
MLQEVLEVALEVVMFLSEIHDQHLQILMNYEVNFYQISKDTREILSIQPCIATLLNI